MMKNEKRIVGIAAAPLLIAVVIAIGIFSTTTAIIQPADSLRSTLSGTRSESKAPSVVTGENVYVAWWNGTAGLPDVQTDIMFRASTDGGQTFGDRINLSNTATADSADVEIHGEADTVIVSWWETNQTSDIPVARVSNDAGETFGPLLMLGTNGTISGTEEEGEEAAAGEGGG